MPATCAASAVLEASATCAREQAWATSAALATSCAATYGAIRAAAARAPHRSTAGRRRSLRPLRTEADRLRRSPPRVARECERPTRRPPERSAPSTLPARPRDGRARRPGRRPPSHRRPEQRVAATQSRPPARYAARAYPRSATPRPRPQRRCRSQAGLRALPSVFVSLDGGIRSTHLAARRARTEPSSEPTMTVPSLRSVAGASTSPPVLKRQSVRPFASMA